MSIGTRVAVRSIPDSAPPEPFGPDGLPPDHLPPILSEKLLQPPGLAATGPSVRPSCRSFDRHSGPQRFHRPSLPLAFRRGSVSGPSPQFRSRTCIPNQPALPARNFVGAAFRQSPPPVRLPPGFFRLGHPCGRSNRPAEIPPGFLPTLIYMRAGPQQVPFRSFQLQPCGRNRLSGIRNLRRNP